MWYSTVNFDLEPSVPLKQFISSLPVVSFLNDYLGPSKVITYLHKFNQNLLQKFDLDFGGEIVITFLSHCPLPLTIPPNETPLADDNDEGDVEKLPPATFQKAILSLERIEELGNFIQ
jgi:hypothetical protein